MIKTSADVSRVASLARTMASSPLWGSEDAGEFLVNASGRIEAMAGEVPGVVLQGVHAPKHGLEERSDEIAADFDLPALPHRLLIRRIEFHINTAPAEVRKAGVPILTTKSSKWRVFVREVVPRWLRRLSEGASPEQLFVMAVAIDGDELLFRVCRYVGTHPDLIRLMSNLGEGEITAENLDAANATMVSVLKRMMAYKAPKAPPAFDKSIVDAAAEAKNFWIEHGKRATVEFFRDRVTEPRSEFARWFCVVMAEGGDLTVVQCRSLLDKHV